MRYKTSLYIDENVDRCSDERSKKKSTSKSRVIESDLQRYWLLLDIGRKQLNDSIDMDTRADIVRGCSLLTGEALKANFIITGESFTAFGKDIREIVKHLSPLERLALLDESEKLS